MQPEEQRNRIKYDRGHRYINFNKEYKMGNHLSKV